MPLMVVELPRDERRGWALAVAVSVILHGAAFAVLSNRETFLSQQSLIPDRSTPSAPAEAPPIMLSLVPDVDAAPTPVRPVENAPGAEAAAAPAEPTEVAETGTGMGAAASDEVGEPAPAGFPGDAHVGPPGEPSGLGRAVPARGLGEGVLAGARINAPTEVRALEPAFDSSMVSGEEGQNEKGGGLGGFLRGVGDFLEGVEIRGGGAGGPGGGGAGGIGGHGGGGKGGGCGPRVPNVGIPQGPIRPGGRIGVGIGRPHGLRLEHAAGEVRCDRR
jgi:translation initiation factor IF-2